MSSSRCHGRAVLIGAAALLVGACAPMQTEEEAHERRAAPLAAGLIVRQEWVRPTFGIGIGLAGLVTADLAGNGKVQIVATAGLGEFGPVKRWYVLSGTPTGYVQDWVSPTYASPISGLRVAQADADPQLEVLVAVDNQVLVYDGVTHQLERTVTTPASEIRGLTVADVDSDGALELVFCDGANLYVLDLATGAEEFMGEGLGGSSLAVGQVDADPNLEIMVANGSSTGIIVDGKTHQVTQSTQMPFGYLVRAGDVDHDGRDEIIAVPGYNSGLRVYDAESSTLKCSGDASDLSRLEVADVDGDGAAEILWGSAQFGGVHIVDGVTCFEKESIDPGDDFVSGIAVGDVDGDSKREILFGTGYTSTAPDYLYVVDPVTKAVKWRSTDLTGPFTALAAGDVDADGRPELLYASRFSDNSYEGGLFFVHDARTKALEYQSRPVNFSDTTGVWRLRIADVDSDPAQEIFVTSSDIWTGIIACYDGATHLKQWSASLPPGLGVVSMQLADVDLDGQLEVVTAVAPVGYNPPPGLFVFVHDAYSGTLEWQSPQLTASTGHELSLMRVANVDDDPAPEIVVADRGGALWVLDRPRGIVQLATADLDITSLDTPDRDHDGRAEIIVGTSGGAIEVIDPVTGAVSSTILTRSSGTAIEGLSVIDVTADGTADYVFAADGQIHVVDGATLAELWTSEVLGPDVGATDSLLVADVDGDGRVEIVANVGGDGLRVYEINTDCARAADGTPCDDGNPCTRADTCQQGLCTSGNAVTCEALDGCHAAGECDVETGACSNPVRPNGTSCGAGTCSAGACVSAADGGTGAPPPPGGCGCGAAGGLPLAALGIGLWLTRLLRRGRRRARALPGLLGLLLAGGCQAPPALEYSENPATYVVNQRIANNAPTPSARQGDRYEVSPALPAGLGLDPATGVISGTPTEVAPVKTYVVKATGPRDPLTCELVVAVNDIPPADLAYSQDPARGVVGRQMADDTPSADGGRAVSFSIAPPLPAGVVLDPSTGVISGTPAEVSPATAYTVTAANSGGTATATLSLEAHAGAVTGSRPLAAGGAHTCAIADGKVLCWGRNDRGQLGNGTTGDAHWPVLVSGISSGVQALVAGDAHTCALVNGGVWCWGRNDSGQVGDGTTADRTAPVQVVGLASGVHAIAAGAAHTCALLDGAVRCWGSNQSGQLGSGTPADSHLPLQVSGFPTSVQEISAGGGHSCALASGAAWCWGKNDDGELGDGSTTARLVPTPVSALTAGVQGISAGGVHTCAIANGGLWCWGGNLSGQLGSGAYAESHVPVQVSGLSSGVQFVSAGRDHTCAVVDGDPRCWGNDDFGQLGDGGTNKSPAPVAVGGFDFGAQAIVAGGDHSCALGGGALRCWGRNLYGQLGDRTTQDRHAPAQVSTVTSSITAVAAGGYQSCAIANDGGMCWGDNSFGQLGGVGFEYMRTSPDLTFFFGVRTVTAAPAFTCALVRGGVACSGGGNPYSGPGPVTGLASGAQALSAGDGHTCALVNGGVQCWGMNVFGELGNDSTSGSSVPVQVSGMTSGVQSVASGGSHTCALVSGAVWCWGRNLEGQLGAGAMSESHVPVQVSGLPPGVQAIAAGEYHTCALAGGAAWCWGQNTYGQLGDGTIADRPAPVPVSGLSSGVQSIALGNEHTCAVVNGKARCWGNNVYGQLGTGQQFQSHVPVPVAGLGAGGVQGIATGSLHTCALEGGGVLCWGYGERGQLGNGGTTSSAWPVQAGGWAP